MTQVVLELPDEVWEQARRKAAEARRSPEDYLVQRLAGDLMKQIPSAEENRLDLQALDLSAFADEQLRALIFTMLPSGVQDRLSELQRGNTEGTLTAEERSEFDRLLRVVQASTLLKAILAQRNSEATPTPRRPRLAAAMSGTAGPHSGSTTVPPGLE